MLFSDIIDQQINTLATEYTVSKNLRSNQLDDLPNYIQKQLNDINLGNWLIEDLFLVGLEPIKEFVFFFTLANLMNKKESKTKSIWKYAIEKYDGESIDLTLPTEILEANLYNFYERKLDHYHTLNAEKKINYLKILELERRDRQKKQERGQKIEGNAKRYKGNLLIEFQLSEFELLDDIKEKDSEFYKYNKTYKRIISESGLLHKLTYKELRDFVSLLESRNNELGGLKRNIQNYKLEFRLGFELLKSVLHAIKKCESIGMNKEEYFKDLCMLFKLPLLKARQTYASIYPTLNAVERNDWREEVLNIHNFVQVSVIKVHKQISRKEKDIIILSDWRKLRNNYEYGRFRNNLKLRKGFDSSHFKSLMSMLDEQNIIAFKQAKSNILKNDSM